MPQPEGPDAVSLLACLTFGCAVLTVLAVVVSGPGPAAGPFVGTVMCGGAYLALRYVDRGP